MSGCPYLATSTETSHRDLCINAYLHPMRFHGPTPPVHLAINIGGDVKLLGEMSDHDARNVLPSARKGTNELEILEQDRKGQLWCSQFANQKWLLLGQNRPMGGEFVRVPVTFHDAPPGVGAGQRW